MSRTYRKKADGTVGSDGSYRYQTPRYQVGSRGKKHHIVAQGVRRAKPDVRRFGEVIVRSALIEANLETAARAGHHQLTDSAKSKDGLPHA